MNQTGVFSKTVIIFLIFALTGFVLYYPVIGNTFLSDDYDSLYRIVVEKRVIYREFLRPMIDISFYFNYLLSGLSARSYYLFNITVHILNSFLLYKLALRYEIFNQNTQGKFAIFSSFLFLIYPFHNESIVWLSGRLSSMACLFALISLHASLEQPGKKGFIVSAIFYIAGLLCYESILLLPAVIILMTWNKYKLDKKMIRSAISWLAVTTGYLLVRFCLSGEIAGSYGGRMLSDGLREKILNTAKVTGRLFIPPMEKSILPILFFVLIVIGIVLINRILFRKKVFGKSSIAKYIQLIIILLISLIIPIAFGVSTRTPEGDRLLYFPSCFLCMLIGTWIAALLKGKPQLISFLLISIYFIFFLEKNNRQWIRASEASAEILQTVKNSDSARIVLINLPDELEGAFVFRNGFYKSLVLNKVDTSCVKVINHLKRLDYLKVQNNIPVKIINKELFIYPSVKVKDTLSNSVRLLNTENNKVLILQKDRNLIYYWDKSKLIKIL